MVTLGFGVELHDRLLEPARAGSTLYGTQSHCHTINGLRVRVFGGWPQEEKVLKIAAFAVLISCGAYDFESNLRPCDDIQHVNATSLPQHAEFVYYLITMYGWETEHWRRLRGGEDGIRFWRRALWILWTSRGTNKWVLGKIRPELSPEAKMMKPRLSYFGQRRQGWLKQTTVLGKAEDHRKIWGPNKR